MSNEITRMEPAELVARSRNVGTYNLSGATSDTELVRLWIASKRSKKTQETYTLQIRKFLLFVDDGLAGVNLTHLIRFTDFLNENFQPSTRALAASAARSLINFAVQFGYLAGNPWPAKTLVMPAPERPNRRLEQDEVQAIIRGAGEGRNRLIVEGLYMSAMRVAEFSSMRWEQIEEVGGCARITVIGKGNKTRVVELPAEFSRRFLARRPADGTGYVWPGRHDDTHLCVQAVNDIIQHATIRAGLAKFVSAHWLRGAHATHADENDAPIGAIRDTLGHASISTTNIYIQKRAVGATGRYLKGSEDE